MQCLMEFWGDFVGDKIPEKALLHLAVATPHSLTVDSSNKWFLTKTEIHGRHALP